MGRINSPSSDGILTVFSIKVSLEMNSIIEEMAIKETKGNKSEMVRILLSEAIKDRGISETTEN